MSEQEKKRQKMYDLLKISQTFSVYPMQSKEKKFNTKEEWRTEQKTNKNRFKCSRYNE